MLGFRAARTPIFRWKGNAPEKGCRLQEFDTNFGAVGLPRSDTDDLTRNLLMRMYVTDGKQLAKADRFSQDHQSTVSIHHRSRSLLGKRLAVGADPRDKNPYGKQDALTAAPLRIPGEAGRKRTQLAPPTLGPLGMMGNITPRYGCNPEANLSEAGTWDKKSFRNSSGATGVRDLLKSQWIAVPIWATRERRLDGRLSTPSRTGLGSIEKGIIRVVNGSSLH